MGRGAATKGRVDAKKPKFEDDIRMRILRFMKARGACTIGEAAKRLRITHEGVRKQMAVLEANGSVARQPGHGTGKRGRPVESYRVTPTGDRLFPKSYDRLAADLITGVAAA